MANGKSESLKSDINELKSNLNDKVSKAGDTMTGNLTIDSGAKIRAKANFKSNGTYSTNLYADQILLLDTEGNNIGYFRSTHYSSGNEALDIIQQRNVNGTNVFNSLQFAITPSGTKIITISDPAAWRKALGYKSEERYSASGSIVLAGFITGNTKEIYLDAIMPYSLSSINTITILGMNGTIRVPAGGYLDNMTGNTSFIASPYTTTAIKLNNDAVRIHITKETAFANAVNNTPIIYWGSLTLNFT